MYAVARNNISDLMTDKVDTKMEDNKDTLQRFIFSQSNVRGEIVHLAQSYQTIMQQHKYPQPLQRLLGEALVASVLLCATIKFKGQLTAQFQGDGPVTMLVAKCNHMNQIKGLAQWDHQAKNVDLEHALVAGQLIVTIERDDKVQPYQSIVPLKNLTIAKALEVYFEQSEQLATGLWITAGADKAAGMLLQGLPGADKASTENFWEHVTVLAATLRDEELITLDNAELLHRLYHQEDLKLFASRKVEFRCHCSLPRMQFAVISLGEKEAMQLLDKKREIYVTCEYCNKSYGFSREEVQKLFAKH